MFDIQILITYIIKIFIFFCSCHFSIVLGSWLFKNLADLDPHLFFANLCHMNLFGN